MSRTRHERRTPRSDSAARDHGAPRDVRASWKVVAATGIVALVAIWPFCHRLLVAFAAINPWKLGGFAMYAAPAPPLVIALYTLRDGRLARIDPAALPVQVRASLQRFEIERHALGELRRPDALATEILAATPAMSQLSIVVQRTVLEPDDARLAVERMQYSYDRSGPRETRRMPVPTAVR